MDIKLNNRKYFFLFLLTGLALYFVTFLNGFVWDDISMIIENSTIHNFDIQKLLLPNLYNSGLFYRPISLLYFALLHSLFDSQAFFYHFLQITFHILCTSLLFIFYSRFFSKGLASILALIFLIHPINVESVAYISASNSILTFLFGMIAFLLGTTSKPTKKKIALIFSFLLLSLLVKETGLLFYLLILLYRYIYKLNKLTVFLYSGLLMGLIYLVLRISIGGVTFMSYNPFIPIKNISLSERLLNIPAIVLYYLKTFIFPWYLSIWQLWVKTANFQDFVIPLLICLSLIISLLIYTHYLYKHRKASHEGRLQGIIFFTVWFLSGMVLLVQFIPLDATVADRWFYFPMAGLLGIIGFVIMPSWQFFVRQRIYLAIIILIISLFSIRTFIRVFDWKDNSTLYIHDANIEPKNEFLLDQAAVILYKDKKYDEALNFAKNSVSLTPNVRNLYHLGLIYQATGQNNEALKVYDLAIKDGKTYKEFNQKEIQGLSNKPDYYLQETYSSLAEAYISTSQLIDAKRILEEAIKEFPNSSRLYYYLAFVEYKTGNNQNALQAIQKSVEISPNKTNTYIYDRLKRDLPVEYK